MKGFSLAEVLIASVLGLLLFSGLMGSYFSVKQALDRLQAMMAIMERGLFAQTLITTDIRMAGYFGCFTRRVLAIDNQTSFALSNPLYTSADGHVLTSLRKTHDSHEDCAKQVINAENLVVHTYFVRDTDRWYSGKKITALYRQAEADKAVELIEGVSDFHAMIHAEKVVVDFILHEKKYHKPWHIEVTFREPS